MSRYSIQIEVEDGEDGQYYPSRNGLWDLAEPFLTLLIIGELGLKVTGFKVVERAWRPPS